MTPQCKNEIVSYCSYFSLTLRNLPEQFCCLSKLRFQEDWTRLNNSRLPVDPIHISLCIYIHADREIHVWKQNTLRSVGELFHGVDLLVIWVSKQYEFSRKNLYNVIQDEFTVFEKVQSSFQSTLARIIVNLVKAQTHVPFIF